jgi:ankyrin repeat protein
MYSDSFDVNQKNSTGHTLLHAVVINGNYDSVLYCLKKGADVNARNNKQQTPLHLAYMHGDQEIINLLESQGNFFQKNL